MARFGRRKAAPALPPGAPLLAAAQILMGPGAPEPDNLTGGLFALPGDLRTDGPDRDACWAALNEPSVGFARSLLVANASLARFAVVSVDPDTGERLGVTGNKDAARIVPANFGGPDTQSEVLATATELLFTVGEAMLILKRATDTSPATAEVRSNEDCKASTTAGRYSLDGVELDPSLYTVIRLWWPSARRRAVAWSPVSQVLPILRQIEALRRHTLLTLESRATRGILCWPSELDPPASPQDRPDSGSLVGVQAALVTPIQDKRAASALSPLIASGAAEYLKEIRIVTLYDHELSAEIRTNLEASLASLALALNVPTSALGSDGASGMNHWSSYLTDSQVISSTEQILNLISSSLSDWAALQFAAADLDNPSAYQLIVDSSGLHRPADDIQFVLDLFDRGLISAEAARARLNVSPAEAGSNPTPAPSPGGAGDPPVSGQLPKRSESRAA